MRIVTLIILAIFALMLGVLGIGILLTAPETVIAVIVVLVLLRFMFKKRKY